MIFYIMKIIIMIIIIMMITIMWVAADASIL